MKKILLTLVLLIFLIGCSPTGITTLLDSSSEVKSEDINLKCKSHIEPLDGVITFCSEPFENYNYDLPGWKFECFAGKEALIGIYDFVTCRVEVSSGYAAFSISITDYTKEIAE